ncbi:hypothetical protein M405DRAFT_832537 [Rhizopogon salebrosus TDB-379]|nr:hypothetical protein M405DRAFT_832537 [Rhizopogon salebrosus TDB-379]
MRRQVQECKGANSIGWVGPVGYGNTNVVEIVTFGQGCASHFMDTNLLQHRGEKAPVGFLLRLVGDALLRFTAANRMPILAKSLHFSYHNRSSRSHLNYPRRITIRDVRNWTWIWNLIVAVSLYHPTYRDRNHWMSGL